MVIQTGFNYEDRLSKVRNFFDQNNTFEDREFLKKEMIDFIYIPKAQLEIPINSAQNNLDLIFENSEILIYKVK